MTSSIDRVSTAISVDDRGVSPNVTSYWRVIVDAQQSPNLGGIRDGRGTQVLLRQREDHSLSSGCFLHADIQSRRLLQARHQVDEAVELRISRPAGTLVLEAVDGAHGGPQHQIARPSCLQHLKDRRWRDRPQHAPHESVAGERLVRHCRGVGE
jgi:hypothetical protein